MFLKGVQELRLRGLCGGLWESVPEPGATRPMAVLSEQQWIRQRTGTRCRNGVIGVQLLAKLVIKALKATVPCERRPRLSARFRNRTTSWTDGLESSITDEIRSRRACWSM